MLCTCSYSQVLVRQRVKKCLKASIETLPDCWEARPRSVHKISSLSVVISSAETASDLLILMWKRKSRKMFGFLFQRTPQSVWLLGEWETAAVRRMCQRTNSSECECVPAVVLSESLLMLMELWLTRSSALISHTHTHSDTHTQWHPHTHTICPPVVFLPVSRLKHNKSLNLASLLPDMQLAET